MRRAFWVIPTTAAISLVSASRMALTVPNLRMRAFLSLGPDARDRVHGRPDAALLSQLPVEGNGEAMGLVSDALDKVEGLEVRGRMMGSLLSGRKTSS